MHSVGHLENRLGDGWSRAKLSRVETARFGISATDLTSLLDLYQVEEHKREPLLRLVRNARTRGWWDAYAGDLPAGYVSCIELESQAAALRCFDAGMINGVMQTEDYARAVIAAGLMALSPPAHTERRVDVRMARQRLLTREENPLRLSAVICEAALRRQAGPAAVVYVETLTGSLLIDSDCEVYRYALAFERLREKALTPAQSAAYLSKLGTRGSADGAL